MCQAEVNLKSTEPQQMVSELLSRQDEVISQIDELNERVERLIAEITRVRQQESQQPDNEASFESDGLVHGTATNKAA